MIVVTKGAFSYLAVPVSERLFGKNKTWRGMLLVPIVNAVVTLFFNAFRFHFPETRALAIGLLLGLAYVLFELPNSYLKRRVGIPPGGTATKRRWLFMLLDKIDSTFGVVLFSYFLLPLALLPAIVLFVSAFTIHVLFSWGLVQVKLKKAF
jgi:CDP-diacylglycerol--serine O-phosphatidyltransferase